MALTSTTNVKNVCLQVTVPIAKQLRQPTSQEKRLRGKDNSSLIWSFDGFIRGWSVTVKMNERLSLHDNQSVKRADERQVTRRNCSPENVTANVFVKTLLSNFKNVKNKATEWTKAIQKIFHSRFFITGVHASLPESMILFA